jgi:hypothetical protein
MGAALDVNGERISYVAPAYSIQVLEIDLK